MIDPSQSFAQGFQGGLSMSERANQLQENVRQFDANNQIAQQNMALKTSEVALQKQQVLFGQGMQEKQFALSEAQGNARIAQTQAQIELETMKANQMAYQLNKQVDSDKATSEANQIISQKESDYAGDFSIDQFNTIKLPDNLIDRMGPQAYQNWKLSNQTRLAQTAYNKNLLATSSRLTSLGINPKDQRFYTSKDIDGNPVPDLSLMDQVANERQSQLAQATTERQLQAIKAQNEGRIGVANVAAQSRENVAGIRAEAYYSKMGMQDLNSTEKTLTDQINSLNKSLSNSPKSMQQYWQDQIEATTQHLNSIRNRKQELQQGQTPLGLKSNGPMHVDSKSQGTPVSPNDQANQSASDWLNQNK